jgi:hypothetical protein
MSTTLGRLKKKKKISIAEWGYPLMRGKRKANTAIVK